MHITERSNDCHFYVFIEVGTNQIGRYQRALKLTLGLDTKIVLLHASS